MDQALGVNGKDQSQVDVHDSSLPDDPEPGTGYLLGHLLRFGQLLRLMGVDVSTRQVLDLVEALDYISISNRFDFYLTCRAILVNRREDFLVFDQAFALFWRLDGLEPEDRLTRHDEEFKRLRLPSKPAPQQGETDGGQDKAVSPGDEEEGESERDAKWVYSPLEVLRKKDFGEMTWEELQQAKAAIASLEWKLGYRRTRRSRHNRKGRLNLRRLVRDNLRNGGEPIRLSYRSRVLRPRSLVILCDVSGSMERYSRMLLHFIHALTHGLKDNNVEAFLFGTRLTRITRHLRSRDVDESMDELGEVVRDWAGGTRIGETLKVFNFEWARRVLGRGAVVLIISDGWDRGELDLLAKEMSRLQRAAYRLIWLNPLLGDRDYRPVQRGMMIALPFVDDFLAVNNLSSLEQLADVLSAVASLRPQRKQDPQFTSVVHPDRPRTPLLQKLGAAGNPYIVSHLCT